MSIPARQDLCKALRIVLSFFFTQIFVTETLGGEAHAPIESRDALISRRLEAFMESQAADNQFSGAILVARNGTVLLAKGYGYANIEWDARNTPETRFRIASVTKPFTATLIMQLEHEGKLQLNDSVCMFLTPCPGSWKAVTIHHLLSHTSGIENFITVGASDPNHRITMSHEKIVATFRDKPLKFSPGEKVEYSNSGYFLLGLVIERVTGKPYEEVLKTQILDPLGMRDTGYDHPEKIIRRRAAGYALRDKEIVNVGYYDTSWSYSAGALYSTVEDLYKFDQALYSDLILSQQAREAMWTPVADHTGYGWGIFELSERLCIQHSGGLDGFEAQFERYPNDKATIIVLSNRPGNYMMWPELRSILFDSE
jgi:CubicO group peptidase (beta-lactamase class C family)